MMWFANLHRNDRLQKYFLLAAFSLWFVVCPYTGLAFLDSTAAYLPWFVYCGLMLSGWWHVGERSLAGMRGVQALPQTAPQDGETN